MADNVLRIQRGVARMRRFEHIVKAAQQALVRAHDVMLVNAGQLGFQHVLFNAEMVVQTGKRAPADVHGGMDVRLGPFHDFCQLRPVVDVLKRHLLHRSAGNNEAVIARIADVIKRLIEFEQMVRRRVGRLVGRGLNQVDFNLNRRVGQTAQNLRFRHDFGRHQIEQPDPKRTNVLCRRPVVRHDENIFALQYGAGGQAVFYDNRHRKNLLCVVR